MELYDYETQHLAYLREHLAECTVLLKRNGRFPLEKPCTLAAYGSGVRRTVKGGTGSGEVNSRFFVAVEEGLEKAGFTLTTKDWLDAYDGICAQAKKQFVKDVKAQARKNHTLAMIDGMGKVMAEPEYQLPLSFEADAAVYVLSRISGEGSDRQVIPGDILLTRTEVRDILALNSRYERFMLVLNVGGPVDLTPVAEVGNILVLSQLGVQTGDALADILLGRYNPSGKLTTTWAGAEDYAPMPDFGDHNDTRYREGIFVGYRYFDAVGKQALFPFGHGLSYTDFRICPASVTLEGDRVSISTCVTNTGAYPGKEVVQVYVSAPTGKLPKARRELAGFAKTELLAPGQRQTLPITFRLRELASFDTGRSAYILEAGDYILHTQAGPAAVIRLAKEQLVRQVKACCGDADFADWQPETAGVWDLPESIPVLELADGAIETETVSYELEEPIEAAVKALTDSQLIYANIGAFNPSAGALSVIGNASSLVAGAAGETTDRAGFPRLVMADGPAGVRVSRQFYRDSSGAHPVGQSGLPESIAQFMPGVVRWLAQKVGGSQKPSKETQVQDQYATAIPVGTALAQSWNVDFARGCGDIVGREMQRFGVHLWLAPALNIHRSIRCGRNFEYYSEDPLLSGKMAAAVTLGVQQHPGCGVTIKHYAANNQETNRYGNNSIVSQRALREIYLKGFGICLQEAKPAAVMTSYNLLNGVHTAQSRELCRDILRCEFGFRGILMTDWVVGGGIMNSRKDIHPAVDPGMVAAAGGDLFMPGCKSDYKAMEKALAEGRLTRQQLQVNASRLCRIAKALTEAVK